MPEPTPHFFAVTEAFIAAIRAATHAAGPGGLLFPDPTIRVVPYGSFLDTTKNPCAMVGAGDQNADEGETTTKIVQKMPIVVKVWFDLNSGTPSQPIQTIHGEIFNSIYRAIMSDEAKRTLNGKCITVNFLRGGTKLTPRVKENPPTQFWIAMFFEAIFRHRVTDSTLQV